MELFSLRDLYFSYGTQPVLRGVSLDYASEDFLAIIGPNGAGKSTLLRLILGLLKLPRGQGQIRLKLPKNQIGYVPQNHRSNTSFNAPVLDVVLMGLIHKKLFGFYTAADREVALAALTQVGAGNLWQRRINELSGGERQRVLIARALVSGCRLLILDEPTASVDTKGAVGIFELLASLHAQGMGVVLVCHDITLVLAYANKIAHLNGELFLHENQKEREKSLFIKHLYENHAHFCAVEMALDSCFCQGAEGGICPECINGICQKKLAPSQPSPAGSTPHDPAGSAALAGSAPAALSPATPGQASFFSPGHPAGPASSTQP